MEEFFALYGPYVGLAAYILVTDGVPFLRDKFFPEWARDRREAKVAERRREEAERAEDRKREDRLFELVQANTQVMGELRGTLESINDQIGRQSEIIHALGLDVAGLYGHIRQPRPSQQRKVTAEAAIGGD